MLLALASLASLLAPQDVLVVDGQGGADFVDLPEAVAAATTGDVILVRAGNYTRFETDGLGISIVAHPDDSAPPRVVGGVVIRNVPAGETLLLDGLSILQLVGVGNCSVDIRTSPGSVRIQDCTIEGEGAPFVFQEYNVIDGICANAASDVAVTDSTVRGGHALAHLGYAAGIGAESGGDAVRATHSNVSMHRTIAVGGDGRDFPNGGIGGSGGTGVNMFGGRLYLGQCFLRAGESGDTGDGIVFGSCIDGSPALFVQLSSSEALSLGTTLIGGEPGAFITAPCSFGGNPGPPVLGDLRILQASPRAIQVDGTVFAGDPVDTTYSGQTGDLAARLVSFDTSWAWRPLWKGTLLVDVQMPQLLQIQGVVPGGGNLTVTEVYSLPLGLQAMTLHQQGLFLTPSGPLLANPRTITVLEPGL